MRTGLLPIYLFALMSLLINRPVHASNTDIHNTRIQLDKIEKLVLFERQTAITLLEQAETNPIITESDSLKAHLFNLKGYSALMGGDYVEADAHFQTALQLSIDSNNKIQEAEAYRRVGLLQIFFNQYSHALTMLNKSLQLHLESGSPKMVNTLSAILNIYELLNQTEQHLEYAWLLLEESIKFKDYTHVAVAHNFIGMAFLKRGDFDNAKYHFSQMQAADQQSNFSFSYMPYLAFAALDKAERNFSSALSNIAKAKAIVEEADFSAAMPSLLIAESEIHSDIGEVELAIQLLNRAIFIATEDSLDKYKIEALSALTLLHEQQGDIALALETLKLKIALETEIQINTERQLLTINQARLDVDTKTRQITQLKYQQQIAAQQTETQVWLLSLTGVIILILSFSALRLRKQKMEIKAASIAIERATNAKSQFLARMSHEIRTPLNAIIGLTKLSLRGSEDLRQATNLKQIDESSQTLLALISDILDFSKIEAGKMQLESAVFSLDEVIDSSMRMITLRAKEKGVELIKFMGPDVPMQIKGDALRLQQVINNLLSNAVKFTDEGSISIVVNRKYSEQDFLLQFEVKDTGRGIPNAKRQILFESFTQQDESITRKYGGTGLGLAISKQLVELMGGEIWVDSLLSQGSTFSFTMKTENAESPVFRRARSNGSPMRALIIDPDIASNSLIEQTLTRMEIHATRVADGMSAVENIQRSVELTLPFDFIFLDWYVTGIDGSEVLSILSQQINVSQQKIVVLTHDKASANRVLGEHKMVDADLQKPINVSTLFNCITGLMRPPTPLTDSIIRQSSDSIDWRDIHILLADDNDLNRKIIIAYLEHTHAKISVAENGEIAVSLLQTDNTFDIVFMDIQMPVLDGLSATRRIRGELNSDIPIVAMTAHANQEDIQKSVDAGMNAHIIKPVEPQFLVKTIQTFLDERSVRRSN